MEPNPLRSLRAYEHGLVVFFVHTRATPTNGISSQQPSALEVLSEWEFIIAPIIFTALAFFTRFYKIGLSPIVTWDEAQLVKPQLTVRCAPDANHAPAQ